MVMPWVVMVGLLFVIFNIMLKSIIGIFFSPVFSVIPSSLQSGYSPRRWCESANVPSSSRPSHNWPNGH